MFLTLKDKKANILYFTCIPMKVIFQVQLDPAMKTQPAKPTSAVRTRAPTSARTPARTTAKILPLALSCIVRIFF